MTSLFQRSDALISPCGLYRYRLSRTWDDRLPGVCFVMLNPSVADASVDDPTIRRCLSFAASWGCGAIHVVNLFAFRSTDPDLLTDATDPIGPDNDHHILAATTSGQRVIAAWGAVGRKYREREAVVKKMLRAGGVRVECLGLTKDGCPRHPLYVHGSTEPMPFEVQP